jgi:hypothetical protein
MHLSSLYSKSKPIFSVLTISSLSDRFFICPASSVNLSVIFSHSPEAFLERDMHPEVLTFAQIAVLSGCKLPEEGDPTDWKLRHLRIFSGSQSPLLVP